MEENIPMATIKAQFCKEDEVETREIWLQVAQVEMSFPLFLCLFSPSSKENREKQAFWTTEQ